ncbi:MAG: hypothetical protein ACRDGB_00030 [Candidatus Limnocylindria bacterium]
MQSRFIIEVGGRRAIAELVGDAPALAGKFWEILPLDSFAISRLERGDVYSAHESVVLLEDLVLLVNRVQTWIDAFVPWATLDDRFPGNEDDIRPGGATRG